MSLIAYQPPASGAEALPSPYFDFAQAVAMRRMALNLSDQPAYLLAPEITLLLDNIADLRRRMLFDFYGTPAHGSTKPWPLHRKTLCSMPSNLLWCCEP